MILTSLTRSACSMSSRTRWRAVGASTPCGVVHLGWLYSDGSTEFLALIARPATDGEAVWSVGNPAHAALAALLVASAGRT